MPVRTELPPDIPARVRADEHRLRQVLLNLLNNAVKFTATGEVSLRIRIEPRPTSGWLAHFAVHDTGIGIPPDALARLFQPFTQADGSTTRRYGGSGLGLAICRQLTELMGGRIGVQSEPGRGSTFWFEIPLDAPLAPGTSRNHSEVPPSGAARAAGRSTETALRVLVAEQNSVNRLFAEKCLGRLGHSVSSVATPDALSSLLAAGTHPVVIVDCSLAGVDVPGMVRDLRHRLADGCPHLVAVSTGDSAAEWDRWIAAGFDAHLTRPISLTALARALPGPNGRRGEDA